MAEASVDFGFRFQDVKRQRELAQQALEEAKRIDELLRDNDMLAPERQHLEETRSKWLEMARALAENASNTSRLGSTTISTITSSYR